MVHARVARTVDPFSPPELEIAESCMKHAGMTDERKSAEHVTLAVICDVRINGQRDTPPR
jgi:hypothetical protein